MNQNPRGLAIIISNKNFGGGEVRKGAISDATLLEKLFGSLGFDVERHIDLTKNEMVEKLQGVASRDHKMYDCLVVAISTHGSHGYRVHGTDHQEISIHTIIKYFDGERCQSLIDKPKIFIVQACCGEGEHASVVKSAKGNCKDTAKHG